MINNNILNTLDNIGFGADIDSFESHLMDYIQVNQLVKQYDNEYSHNEMLKMLKELKSESIVFSSRALLEKIENTSDDSILSSIPYRIPERIYGTHDKKLKSIQMFNGTNSLDLVAAIHTDGIPITCQYKNGNIYKIYAVSGDSKYIDLTKLLKNKVASSIEELKQYNLCECRGYVTIPNASSNIQKKSMNTQCSTMRCIRTQTNLENLQIVIDDIQFASEDIPFDNQWDKLKFLERLGLNIPNNALVRDITREVFEQALSELFEYFENISNTEGMPYSYSYIEIREGKDILNTKDSSRILYTQSICDPAVCYESTVKSVHAKFNGIKTVGMIKIVPVNCNGITVDSIDIQDFIEYDSLNIHSGGKVKFKIIDRKPRLLGNNK